jgi:long-chain acyl-CoA synthetase
MGTYQNVARLPLPAPAHAGLPVGSVDVLPRLAARAWPNRTALHSAAGPVSFAELDRRISRLASGIRDLLGGEGSVVALSAVLGAGFPVAYYAVLRSGNVVAPVNPRLGAEVLERLLESVSARAAVLNRTMYERVRPVLTGLEHVLLLDEPGAAGVPSCADLAGRGDLLVEPHDRDENELGAIMFGGGPTGHAGLTHHRVKVDAATIGAAHGLTENAVAVNGMPTYHPAHLNAAVWAGATQVFCASQDPVALAREVERHAASHCYAPGAQFPPELPRRAVAS